MKALTKSLDLTPTSCLMFGAVILILACQSGCSVEDAGTGTQGGQNGTGLSQDATVMIDGSSTVFPISQAVAEEFQKLQPNVKVVVGTSGTGGGFKKFVVGETDINDASRPIKESEVELCEKNGIEFLELKVAIDGLSVIVHPSNSFCDCLTVAQLKSIWEPDSKVKLWSEVDASWPEEEIKLFGPDTDSGTFDYFTEAICGEGGASRTDYTPSANDNILVQGVSGDKFSLGYFGYAYYAENQDKLKIVGVADGDDKSACVIPSDESINAGQYVPLSRPLFLYVNKASLQKPHVAAFLRYYLDQGQKLVQEVRYVPLAEADHKMAQKSLEAAIEGQK